MTELELIDGDLRAYREVVPGTFQDVRQLTKARMTDPDLCNWWLHAADGNAYRLGKGGSVLWGIIPESGNLILTHLFDERNSSFEQLITDNFCSKPAESAQAWEQAEIVDLARLSMQTYRREDTFRYLKIRTKDGYVFNGREYVPQNPEEKKALVRIGFTEEYLSFLADNSVRNIETTLLYVLDPSYVLKKAVDGNTLWQPSALGDFNSDSSTFDACGLNVRSHYRFRGVRRVIVAASREGSHERSDLSDGAKNEVPSAPQETTEAITIPTMKEILTYSAPFVPEIVRSQFEEGLQKLYER